MVLQSVMVLRRTTKPFQEPFKNHYFSAHISQAVVVVVVVVVVVISQSEPICYGK